MRKAEQQCAAQGQGVYLCGEQRSQIIVPIVCSNSGHVQSNSPAHYIDPLCLQPKTGLGEVRGDPAAQRIAM